MIDLAWRRAPIAAGLSLALLLSACADEPHSSAPDFAAACGGVCDCLAAAGASVPNCRPDCLRIAEKDAACTSECASCLAGVACETLLSQGCTACQDTCADCGIAMCGSKSPTTDGPQPEQPATHDMSYVDSLPGLPCVEGAGTHRLWLQGRGEDPDALGRYPLYEDAARIVHGEHFLVGRGSFVEFIAPLCGGVSGHVRFYMPNNEDPMAIADVDYQLLVVRDGVEALVAQTRDNVQYGSSGYVPYEAEVTGTAQSAERGDLLVLRVTNRSDNWYAMVIFFPPSEYMAWIEIDVL